MNNTTLKLLTSGKKKKPFNLLIILQAWHQKQRQQRQKQKNKKPSRTTTNYKVCASKENHQQNVNKYIPINNFLKCKGYNFSNQKTQSG